MRRGPRLVLLTALTVVAVGVLATMRVPLPGGGPVTRDSARVAGDTVTRADSLARRDSLARADTLAVEDPPCVASRFGLPCR